MPRHTLLGANRRPASIHRRIGQRRPDRNGREWFQRNRGERPGATPDICCAWFDEFDQAQHDCVDDAAFRNAHLAFARQRHARLGKEPVRRRGELLPLAFSISDKGERRRQFALSVRDAALRLHADHHSIDPHSAKRVSFGLVRMANIDPLFDVALALYQHGAPQGVRIHLCVYHSRFPLLVRSRIEARLDLALDRRKPEAVFALPDVRERIGAHAEVDHVFIVLGSPVTEVGRDHDYDWAVVEPSSMRSLIQLAGRVRRHRPGSVEAINLLVLDRNLRSVEQPDGPAFRYPGFETAESTFRLVKHNLQDLLERDEIEVIDARPRILPCADGLQPTERLIDLEHSRLAAQMLPVTTATRAPTPRELRNGSVPARPPINAASHWQAPDAWLAGALPQQQRFRDDSAQRETDLVLLPNDDEDDYALHRVDPGERKWEPLYVRVEDSHNHRIQEQQLRGERMAPWGDTDYWQVLLEHAETEGISLRRCAERYGTVSVPHSTQGWRFHPALGFTGKG